MTFSELLNVNKHIVVWVDGRAVIAPDCRSDVGKPASVVRIHLGPFLCRIQQKRKIYVDKIGKTYHIKKRKLWRYRIIGIVLHTFTVDYADSNSATAI